MDFVDRLIDLAIDEDVGPGDVTTDLLVPAALAGTAEVVAKEALVVAGLDTARRVFARFDGRIDWRPRFEDGDEVAAGEKVVTLSGRMRALLTGERIALNFLQRLSGIATGVRRWLPQLAGSAVRLVDTRKTAPGWRALEKYAVRVGGAHNHRMALYDGVLIKDNHIAACGGIGPAIQRARRGISHLMKIEVEVATVAEALEAVAAGAEVILLDNMDLPQIEAAVKAIAGKALVEVSGGVTAEALPQLAAAGVDILSSGALTHSARSVDLSMRIAAVAPSGNGGPA